MSQWDNEKPKRKREQYTDPNDYLSQKVNAGQRGGINLNSEQLRPGCGCTWVFGLLAAISFVAIFVFAFGVAFFPAGAAAVSPVFCPPNTTMRTVEGERTYDGTEVFFRCFDLENQLVEDVSWKFVLAIFGLISLPFIFIGLSVWSTARGAVRTARTFAAAVGNNPDWTNFTGGTVSINTQTVDLREKMKRGELTQQDLENLTGAVSQFFEGNDSASNVTERLRELKEAYDAGLVTRDEYERKRTEILDSL